MESRLWVDFETTFNVLRLKLNFVICRSEFQKVKDHHFKDKSGLYRDGDCIFTLTRAVV